MSVGELLFDAQCQTTESPVWDQGRRCVYFADTDGGRIFRYHVDSKEAETWPMPERIGSFGLCASGALVVALARRIMIFDPETGAVADLTGEVPEPAHHLFNDGKVGPDGCFWVGTKTEHAADADRRSDCGLYRVRPDGTLEQKADGFMVTNGLAWSPQGKTMYHADSPKQLIQAWDFDPATATMENRRIFVEFEKDFCRPDGAACDSDGNYWVAGVRNGVMCRVAPSGEVLDSIVVCSPSPSMLCFGDGAVYFTSLARPHVKGDAEHPHNVAGLFRLETSIAGTPITCFADR